MITPEFLSTYGVTLDDLDARPYLTRVHFAGIAHRRVRRGLRAGREALVITRAGALLGLPPGVPDPVWHIAFWRDLLVVLALAAAASEARGRRALALGIATLFAILAVGFWVAALGRPYGVLSDPGTTRLGGGRGGRGLGGRGGRLRGRRAVARGRLGRPRAPSRLRTSSC